MQNTDNQGDEVSFKLFSTRGEKRNHLTLAQGLKFLPIQLPVRLKVHFGKWKVSLSCQLGEFILGKKSE